MLQNKADYTNTFCFLMNEYDPKNEIYKKKQFVLWKKKWENRINLNNNSKENSIKIMSKVNPLVIPRNYLVEESLKYATEKDDLSKVNDLLKVLKKPYERVSATSIYQSTPFPEENYVTYCGT